MRKLISALAAMLALVAMVVAGVMSSAPAARAEANGVGLTPLMGWSTWSIPGGSPSAASDEAAALALKTSGLLKAGYNYVNQDDFWYDCPGSQGPDVDSYGRWVTDATRFPPGPDGENGIEVVAKYVHSLGEKFGIYVTPGISMQAVTENTPIEGTSYTADEIAEPSVHENNYNCGGMVGINYSKPGAQQFIDSWADEFASWGVDYVKVDGVGSFDIPDVQAWSNALRQTGRPIHLELSNSLNIDDASTWEEYSNGWRTGGDIQCYCGDPYPVTTWSNVESRFNQVAEWAPYGEPGAFNDYDSLTIGSGPTVEGLSATQEESMMSLWALGASPLVINADMTSLDPADLSILENRAVIGVDQDAIDATRISDTSTSQVFAKTEKTGDVVVGLFNTGSASETISTTTSALGLPAGSYSLRDLWANTTSTTTGQISATVPSDGVALYRVAPVGVHIVYSRLRIDPLRVQNQYSGPASPAGQSLNLVRVQATVTNTGTTAGPGAADLYLADPRGSGQPGRLLKSQQNVSLQPGQSTTVTFDLTGLDLSAWNWPANGWVVPDGRFTVYVGASPGPVATSGLPLQGSFTVTRTVGARYATATAPSTVAPASAFSVSARFVNDGDYAMSDASFALQAPQGWQVTGLGRAPSRILAHQTVTEHWTVQAPVAAQGTSATLTAELNYQPGVPGQQQGTLTAAAPVSVEPALTVTASPVSLAPGQAGTSTLTVTSVLPSPVTLSYAATAPAGITVTPAQGTLTVPSAGATTTLTVTASSGASPGANQVPLALSFTDQGQSYPLTSASVPVAVPFPSLAAAFDNVGISDDTDTGAANIDGDGSSFSAQALASVGVTPGASLTYDGIGFTWPDVAAGQPDNVVGSGQTIDLSGSGTTLGLLDTSVYGNSSGTGTITYTDGTTQSFSLDVPNWYETAPAGSNAVIVAPYRNRPGNTQDHTVVNVFEQSIPLQAGKTVEAVTLPDISASVVREIPSLHVFAIAIGG
jgi:hypothetical protein